MRDEFLQTYVKSLRAGHAALFAGAGLSRAAGYVDWKGLLSGIAHDLKLEIDLETDLLSLAQYHFNERQSRAHINQKLIEEFTEGGTFTENHRLLAQLPLRTVWTTNYDTLLEDAFKANHKRVDKKIIAENLALSPRADVTIYKMHGDISLPNQAVLLKDDYELYNETRQLFTTQLQGHLVSHTFLFLGLSFTDPNIDQILARIRILLRKDVRPHYWIVKRIDRPSRMQGKAKAEFEYCQRKQELRIADLRRYGIQAVEVDSYAEVTELLREVARRINLNNIFVSGSCVEYGSRGATQSNDLARALGREIIKKGYNLISGFGLGVGSEIIAGAMEAAYQDQSTLPNDRVTLRPFPQGASPAGMTLPQFWQQYRQDMIAPSGIAVFLAGNKDDGGSVVLADGVRKEFEICKSLGKYPIPIGATGYVAQEIWSEVQSSLDQFYPDLNVKKEFQVLGDANSTNEQLLKAVFAIVERVNKV